MTEWLKLNEAQRKTSLEQAALKAGMQVKAVEKDWWVTLTLKALFNSKYNAHLLFKGGTSLSKGWKLIERFSEDIDIALAAEAFGIINQENPSKTFVEKLRKKGCEFTSNELKKELELQFAAIGVPEGMISVEAAPVKPNMPDTDPQSLFVKYPSLFDTNPYLAEQIKVEVSVRSMKEPFSKIKIESILNEHFPNPVVYPEIPFDVVAVEAHRTFLEKAFLLHEEFLRPEKIKIRAERMSRHLYDLERMMDSGSGTQALSNDKLYSAIILHRQNYSRLSWVDYTTLERDKVSFLPPKEFMESYRKDYEVMKEQMIYGETPSFDELIKRLNTLLERFRNKA
ncbi:MAG: nucleotidyl transferase AbiEii/AbiGii toxin family protein [Bacteroidetes bacterium]|nr:nucleotidyl transferase AbiEii/AbiGii toxin family protein [Bacteroidota bacterium]